MQSVTVYGGKVKTCNLTSPNISPVPVFWHFLTINIYYLAIHCYTSLCYQIVHSKWIDFPITRYFKCVLQVSADPPIILSNSSQAFPLKSS